MWAVLIPAALLVHTSTALVVRDDVPKHALALDSKKVSPVSAWAHRFSKSHCFEERLGRSWSALTQLGQEYVKKASAANPGAGMGKIVPFKTILNDGFAVTDCVKDELYYHGDKFYDNRHSYKLGALNISVVHYARIVPKEDREPMTPEVCFDFCRTVPDMKFFGIVNGRDCYCTPYFKRMASSSEECDSVCEGDNTQMCGGKSKSSVFEMHMCADTAGDLKQGAEKLDKAAKKLTESAKVIKDMAKTAEKESEDLQKLFARIGDIGAGQMLREAQMEAGELIKVANQAGKVEDATEEAEKKGEKLLAAAKKGGKALLQGNQDQTHEDATDANNPFADYKMAKKAEDTISDMSKASHAANTMNEKLDDTLEFHNEVATEEGKKMVLNRSQSYYHAYYFAMNQDIPEAYTGKNWGKDKSTCTGDLAQEPIFGVSMDECAYACDKIYATCEAFQYFAKQRGICILFKKLTSVTHWDMCSHDLEGKCRPVAGKSLLEIGREEDELNETVTSVPFPWKTKSETPNATLFKETVNGMCTTVHGCDGVKDGETVSDCSLMSTYQCDEVNEKRVEDDGKSLKMFFRGWLESGRRDTACKVNPDPCPRCKIYSTCSGPYAETKEVKIKKGDVASYTWRSSGKTDNYEVFVGLYSTTCGLVDFQFQRGAAQPFQTFELFAPKTDMYYMKFMLASYDGSGGGAVGADMEVKDVKQTKATIPRVFDIKASCMARTSDFQGSSIKPDPSGNCKNCLKMVTKKCLKPDGTFPEPPKDDKK